MVARDPHRFVNQLDKAAIDRLIARLESRAKDEVFTRLFDKYAAHIDPGPLGRTLEVGSGTGAMTRSMPGLPRSGNRWQTEHFCLLHLLHLSRMPRLNEPHDRPIA